MRKVVLALVLLGLFAKPAKAHRLDEYLQATLLSLEPGHVTLTMRLVPGVAVAPAVIASIDRNADGSLSADEQQAYAQSVLSELFLKKDGHLLQLRLVDASFPSIVQMQAGVGEIKLTLVADFPVSGGIHRLSFENHHEPAVSVYLVNALAPQDAHLQIDSQERNRNQSFYQVSFTDSALSQPRLPGFSGFAGAFHLGLKHIAEGTDHLLFLLTLLLPAPLLAYGRKWRQPASVNRSLLHVLGIVTAFTLGHSLTLALSVFGFVQLPSRPVEILIAVSILISAIHALRPIFPGREAVVAACFGLIHGLAFASALNELGMTGWYRLVSLFGFNLGIESMQLFVVLATLPSLLLLSRTRWYVPARIIAASLAAFASVTWIIERVSNRPNSVGSLIESLSHHGGFVAAVSFLVSLLAWMARKQKAPYAEQRP